MKSKVIYPTFFNSALFITPKGTQYSVSAYCEPEITNNLFLKINNHTVVYNNTEKSKLLSDYNRIVDNWSSKYSRV